MKIFVLICLMMFAVACYSQNMLKQLNRENNKWRFSPGLRLGEPLGLDLLLYKGINCKSRRPWKIDISTGIDGGMWGDGTKSYSSGTWRQGGWQTALMYYHSIPVKYLSFLNFGIGAQAGKRRFETASFDSNEFSFGLNVAINTYLVSIPVRLSNRNVLQFTLMADARYHRDLSNSFQYFRPSFSLMVDYFRN